MVSFAMQYVGYPYVWATRGPNSFDCSGFTYWVAKNVLGIDITGGVILQWGRGTPVPYGSLQPGDLVFFQNTYTTGLSHVGLYIGNNQFVHAANEGVGVIISNLTTDYYASRWFGARRLA
jgi:cell wall-associated NlpC family hydrolase